MHPRLCTNQATFDTKSVLSRTVVSRPKLKPETRGAVDLVAEQPDATGGTRAGSGMRRGRRSTVWRWLEALAPTRKKSRRGGKQGDGAATANQAEARNPPPRVVDELRPYGDAPSPCATGNVTETGPGPGIVISASRCAGSCPMNEGAVNGEIFDLCRALLAPAPRRHMYFWIM